MPGVCGQETRSDTKMSVLSNLAECGHVVRPGHADDSATRRSTNRINVPEALEWAVTSPPWARAS